MRQKDPSFIPVDERPTVKIKDTKFQPTRKQLEAGLRVSATFDQAIEALCNPIQVIQEKS